MLHLESRGQSKGMLQSDIPVRVFLADDSALVRQRVAAMLGARAMAIVGHTETPQGAIDGILAALAEGASRFLDKTSEFDQLVPAVADASRHLH